MNGARTVAVYIGGAFSHAFASRRSCAASATLLSSRTNRAPPAAAAEHALAAAPGAVTYARVDVVPAPDGHHLMELS